ncbi:PA2778 family cysteine peptidase [Methylonatrum kenyense]|uniref:PA2778 family cysteine peptidase n=1 Tax=Methylonatrum kenyense TaxID=455253 RepID=UPI0020BD9E3F|nr:PA2778 family cysteine peptidase [Methylonatrum kenyense]
MYRHKQRIHVLLLLAVVLLAACARTPLQIDELETEQLGEPRAVELTEVPFFPQEAYQCGPAAMATLMNHRGLDIAPEDLTPQMYLPGRRGSLQIELLTSARRQGFLAYVHEPELTDLLAQVRVGHPVLILQNLALERVPVWHYAVVVGFDLDAGEVLLRSGTTKRERMSLRRFERTWQRGDYWAITLHQPGDVPERPDETRYLRAVAALEQVERWPDAEAGYRAAIQYWPDSATAWFGLGNTLYQQDGFADAEDYYRQALRRDALQPAIHHNLAWALIRQDRPDEARPHAEEAARLADEGQSHYRTALDALP